MSDIQKLDINNGINALNNHGKQIQNIFIKDYSSNIYELKINFDENLININDLDKVFKSIIYIIKTNSIFKIIVSINKDTKIENFSLNSINKITDIKSYLDEFLDSEKKDFQLYRKINMREIKRKLENFHISYLYNSMQFEDELQNEVKKYINSFDGIIKNSLSELLFILKKKKFDLNYNELYNLKNIEHFITYRQNCCQNKKSFYQIWKMILEDYNDFDYRIMSYFIRIKKEYKLNELSTFIKEYNLNTDMDTYVYRWKPMSLANICEIKCIENSHYNKDCFSMFMSWAILMRDVLDNDEDSSIVCAALYCKDSFFEQLDLFYYSEI